MKKKISFMLVLIMMLTALFSFGSVAFASTFTVTANPTSLAAGGDVTFNFVVFNDSGSTLTTQIMYGSTPVADVSVANGENREGSFTMAVTDAMLGQTLTFTCNGMQATTKVDKKVLTPKIAASAVVPYTLYGEGDTVKFEFKIENQGDAQLDNIVVTAPELNGGKALNTGFSLAPGETATKKFSYTMGKDITVNPVVNYSVGGAAQTPFKMTPVPLTKTNRKVEPVLAASNMKPAPGEEVTFTLTLTNSGNVPYSDIKILVNGEAKDFPSKLGAVGTDTATSTGTFKMTFTTSTQVACSISLKDHTGKVVQINSNTVSIDLPVDATAVDSKLGFTMAVDRPQLTSAGSINFSGMITNGTDYELKTIKITEATLGEIYSADTLAAGSTASIAKEADINATTTYNFVLTATDKDGNQYTKTAEPVTVTIQSAQATATPGFDDAADVTQTALAPDGNLGAGSIGTLGIIAIILVVLIIGVGVALIVLWKKGQGPSRPSSPGRKRPVASSPARRRPTPQKSYRDRNNF